jgi:hypothetical protein
LVFRPVYYTLRLDAEWAMLDWMRLFGSIGIGTSFPAEQKDDNNRAIATYDNSTDEIVSGSGAVSASQLALSYTATKIPIDIGIKFTPPRGRFLPFALVGVGVSWHQFQFDKSALSLIQQQNQGGGCPATYDLDTGSQLCILDADLGSEGIMSGCSVRTWD